MADAQQQMDSLKRAIRLLFHQGTWSAIQTVRTSEFFSRHLDSLFVLVPFCFSRVFYSASGCGAAALREISENTGRYFCACALGAFFWAQRVKWLPLSIRWEIGGPLRVVSVPLLSARYCIRDCIAPPIGEICAIGRRVCCRWQNFAEQLYFPEVFLYDAVLFIRLRALWKDKSAIRIYHRHIYLFCGVARQSVVDQAISIRTVGVAMAVRHLSPAAAYDALEGNGCLMIDKGSNGQEISTRGSRISLK